MEINISQTLRRLKLDQKLTSIRLAASFFPNIDFVVFCLFKNKAYLKAIFQKL